MTDTYPNFPKEKWLQKIYIYTYAYTKTMLALKGGQGSGNFGHEGRPGQVGGSGGGNINLLYSISSKFEEIRGYNYIGLRGLQKDEKYEIGDTARNSLDWDFENDTSADYELNGTSTLGINMSDFETPEELIKIINDMNSDISKYGDGRIVLLGGYDNTYGDDPNESVIREAKVIAFVK